MVGRAIETGIGMLKRGGNTEDAAVALDREGAAPDLAGFARAASIETVQEFDDPADFDRRIGGVQKEQGPVFVVLKVVAGETDPQDWSVIHSGTLHQLFAEALAKA